MNHKLTTKQIEILRLLYIFRFLNRHQIQTLFHHKSFNRINVWLADLVECGLVGRIYSQAFGENTKPAIYYLSVKSKKFLSSIDGFSDIILKRVYRERGRSKRFINHCVTVGNVYIYLTQLKTDKLIQFLSKEELVQEKTLIQPVPDAYFAVERPDGSKYRFFLEVFDQGIPRYAIRKRIMDYIEYSDGKSWEEKTGQDFPGVLCACPNDWMKNYLYRLIKAVGSDSEVNFYLTVYSNQNYYWQLVK